MDILINPRRGAGIDGFPADAIRSDAAPARALLARCPIAAPTPLLDSQALAAALGIGALHLKDERGRMGLGSFKALGAAFAIARRAQAAGGSLPGVTFVCASAGNHGLSMAAGACVFGAEAVVYLAQTVPEDFAQRLRAKGARVVREGDAYEASMAAAMRAADEHGWVLLSDSSWTGYSEPARDVMEGYLIMGAEAAEAMPAPPTHVFLQAGVGGLAAACAASARAIWGGAPRIVVVEPSAAPALIESIRAGAPVDAAGPVSTMGRLDCKTPSHLALGYLAREADVFMTVTDAQVAETVDLLSRHGVETSPSGGAGVAGVHHGAAALGLDTASRVLAFISEGADAA